MFIKTTYDGDSICYINIYNITNVVVDGEVVTIYMANNDYPISLSREEAEPLLLKCESLCK